MRGLVVGNPSGFETDHAMKLGEISVSVDIGTVTEDTIVVKEIVIEDLYIRDGKVSVSASFLGGKALGAPLPDIHLEDVGKDEGGASPAEIAQQITEAITGSAGTAVGSIGELAGKITGGVAGAAAAITKGIGDAIKGLFKRWSSMAISAATRAG